LKLVLNGYEFILLSLQLKPEKQDFMPLIYIYAFNRFSPFGKIFQKNKN